MTERKNIGDINRERFEKKWGYKWKDRTWKILESVKQDIDFLIEKDNSWEKEQLDSSLRDIEKLIEEWGDAIQYFTTTQKNFQTQEFIISNYTTKQLVEILYKKIQREVLNLIKQKKEIYKKKVYQKKNVKSIEDGIDRIYEMMSNAKEKGHRPICVFAPMYNKENEKDGYIQRIKAIDTTVLKNMFRIYLYDEGVACETMRFDYIDELHGYIVFNSHNANDVQEILKLVKACGKTYIHSILRFIEDRTCRDLWKMFDLENVYHIWDMHGVVPEEYQLSGSELGAKLANNIETLMAEKVDVVVVVTEAMKRYFKNKYPKSKSNVVVVPILNEELLKPVETKKELIANEISIVYAGGIQPWQNIELMQDIIEKTNTTYHYKIYVPNIGDFWKLWGERKGKQNITVESKTTEELYKEYEKCDFGFVLRDSSPVNYVACPTKIIEYLKFGIIPILKSEEIGDFVDLGMSYISFKEMINGISITEEQRLKMLRKNQEVLIKLMNKYIEGLKKLTNIVEA